MIAETLKLIAEKGHVLCTAYALFAKTNSKPTIRYMTEAEVMEYLISTKDRK